MKPKPFLLYEWIQRYRPTAKHNLAMSGIKKPNLRELGVDVDYEALSHHYSHESRSLERILAETYGVPPDHFLVTSSGSEALFLCVTSFAGPGDEVLVHVPNYPPIFQLPQMFSCRVKYLRSNFRNRFSIDLEGLEEALRGRPKMLMLSNSNNPSGRIIEPKDLTSIIEMADRHGIIVVVDEAFREFGFERAPPISASLGDNVLTLNTMSKFYGMDGLRIGWVIGNPKLLARMHLLKNMITIENATLSEALPVLVMENREIFVNRARAFAKSNLAMMRTWIERRDDMSWVEPEAALFGFPRYEQPMPSRKFAQELAEKFKILVAPGEFFGTERHLRLCVTQSPDEVQHALADLGNALDEISNASKSESRSER